MSSSPVQFDKPFVVKHAHQHKFHGLGSPRGKKGVIHTLYLSKKLVSDTVSVSDLIEINGQCKYAFVSSLDQIVGVLFITPAALTTYTAFNLRVGQTSEDFTVNYTLQPQGLLICDSSDGNTLIVSQETTSPLLIKVEL
jgi:hypothetical protein